MPYENFIVPFGKHQGKTLKDTPVSYLAWMRGLDNLYPDTKQALEGYLSDPVVKEELAREIAKEDIGR